MRQRHQERGEECDDGNQVDGGPGDFCLNNCTTFFPANCQAPANYVVCDDAPDVISNKGDKNNMLKAIGICNDTLANSIVTTDFQHSNPVDVSWQVTKGYGNYTYDHDNDANTPPQRLYSPREGSTFLIISNGEIAPPNGEGVVIEAPNNQGTTDNGNPDDMPLPLPFKAVNGSNNGAGGTPVQELRQRGRRQRLLRHHPGAVGDDLRRRQRPHLLQLQDRRAGRDLRLHLRVRVLLGRVADVGRHRRGTTC